MLYLKIPVRFCSEQQIAALEAQARAAIAAGRCIPSWAMSDDDVGDITIIQEVDEGKDEVRPLNEFKHQETVMATPKFTRAIEEALEGEKMQMSDLPPDVLDTALDTLIHEDYHRGVASKEFQRGVLAMVVNAARRNAGLRLHPDGSWE